ncbi:MAG: DegV family protein [Oscillospiraceae bacterium]|nr:DegV family protein [Oscillospiraceae bacterium]
MSFPYLIFTDPSADFDPALGREQEIGFVPMNYSIGGQTRQIAGLEQESVLKQFYDGQRHGDLTQTSQISPQVYIDLFRPMLLEGQSVLYLALSSGLSGTYQSACMAAQELNQLHPQARFFCVDSLGATAGMGLLLEAAADNRAAGMSIEENVAWLEENRLRVCHWFVVEDLMYLKRGGRVSSATAVVGTALNIKPVLTIEEDGTLKTVGKIRGAKAALKQLVSYYAQSSPGGQGERIIVLHADNPSGVEFLEDELKKLNPACRMTRVGLSPIIGAHTGPGMCAFVHFGKRILEKY